MFHRKWKMWFSLSCTSNFSEAECRVAISRKQQSSVHVLLQYHKFVLIHSSQPSLLAIIIMCQSTLCFFWWWWTNLLLFWWVEVKRRMKSSYKCFKTYILDIFHFSNFTVEVGWHNTLMQWTFSTNPRKF